MSWLGRILAPAIRVPVIGLLCMGLGLVGIRVGLLRPVVGFGVFMLGWVGGAVGGVVTGAVAVWRFPGSEAGSGWAALVVGALLLAAFLPSLSAIGAPPIHDVTTDLEDPPAYRAAPELPANRERDMQYPVGGNEVPRLQRRDYPELGPLRLGAPSGEVFDAVLKTADELGWTITWSYRGGGVVEARDMSPLFRFIDDVVVRVRSTDGGSVIDVRSTSRVGRGDLGANARRIRRFQEALRSRIAGR